LLENTFDANINRFSESHSCFQSGTLIRKSLNFKILTWHIYHLLKKVYVQTIFVKSYDALIIANSVRTERWILQSPLNCCQQLVMHNVIVLSINSLLQCNGDTHYNHYELSYLVWMLLQACHIWTLNSSTEKCRTKCFLL
jgi:hypothetical protein